jgi:hypothetical protein
MTEETKKAAITAIQKIAKTYNVDLVTIINATVESVDKDKRTCVVTPLSGQSDTPIEDVGLMVERNDGEFKIPSVGSTVGVVMSTQVDPYIISWSDLDEWYVVIGNTTIDLINGTLKLGDGTDGGLIKIDDLKSQWDANIQAIKAVFQTVFAAIDTSLTTAGGPAVAVSAYNPLAINIKELNKLTLENTTVKHGG